MPEPRDECRPVALPSGETIRARSSGPLDPVETAALGEIVDAARARFAAEHPANPTAGALWSRLVARTGERGISLRDAAHECGVRSWTVLRVAQGYVPGEVDMAAIEAWLGNQDNEGA